VVPLGEVDGERLSKRAVELHEERFLARAGFRIAMRGLLALIAVEVARLAAGRARGGRTSFETLGGNVQLLTESERRFTYYDLSLGYNFLPGEAFIGRGIAMTSAFYLLGGIGGTDFAGDTKFTVNFGAGYRVVPADWLAVHITVQDRVFQSSLLGTTKLTNNLEARIGTTVFF